MTDLFKKFKEKVMSSVSVPETEAEDSKKVDNLIALGVLLWIVAEADEVFLPQETEKIKEVLVQYSHIREEDMPIVLRSIKEANIERIDVHAFSAEVSQNLKREDRIQIMEDLFRVACIDQDLDQKEHEMIRLISSLFRLEHKEFIDSKVKIKKEFGMDTAGL